MEHTIDTQWLGLIPRALCWSDRSQCLGMYCMVLFPWDSQRQNHRDGEQISGCQQLGLWGRVYLGTVSTGRFWSEESACTLIVVVVYINLHMLKFRTTPIFKKSSSFKKWGKRRNGSRNCFHCSYNLWSRLPLEPHGISRGFISLLKYPKITVWKTCFVKLQRRVHISIPRRDFVPLHLIHPHAITVCLFSLDAFPGQNFIDLGVGGGGNVAVSQQ